MSNQCDFPIRDLNPCNDMDAWWTMITSVYNFLSASTNLAQTLDRKYANHPTSIHSPLLIEESNDSAKVIFPEDFPWFLQLLNVEPELPEISSNKNIISDEQVRYYCDIRPEIISGMMKHAEKEVNADLSYQHQLASPFLTKDTDENIDIERALRSMHALEQSIIQSYLDDEEEALCKLSENMKCVLVGNQKLKSEQNMEQRDREGCEKNLTDDEAVIANQKESVKGYASDDSCYFHEFSDSEQTIDSVNLQSAYESLENIDRISLSHQQKNFVHNEKHNENLVNLESSVGDKSTREQSSSYEEKEIINVETTINNITKKDEMVSVDFPNSRSEQKSCPKCHKPSKCKHDEPIEKRSEKNSTNIMCRLSGNPGGKTGKLTEDSLKMSSSDMRHSKYIAASTKTLTKKNYSDIVPKNINELREHLNSISKSRLSKNAARTVSKPHAESNRLPEDANELKNVNFTVFTAKMSYRGQQKNDHFAKKNSRVYNRFASVESVVKKLITGSGGKITERKDCETSKISELKKRSLLKTQNKLRISEETIQTDADGKTSTDGSTAVGENKSEKCLEKLTKHKSENSSELNSGNNENELHILDEKALRNKYTLSSPLRTAVHQQELNKKKASISRNKVDSGIPQRNLPTSNHTTKQKDTSKQISSDSNALTAKKHPSKIKSQTWKNKK